MIENELIKLAGTYFSNKNLDIFIKKKSGFSGRYKHAGGYMWKIAIPNEE